MLFIPSSTRRGGCRVVISSLKKRSSRHFSNHPVPPPASSPPPPVRGPLTDGGTDGSRSLRALAILLGGATGYCLAVGTYRFANDGTLTAPDSTAVFKTGVSLSNWSGTHVIEPDKYYEPSSSGELVQLVQDAHKRKQKLRPVGTALSPNGIGFCQMGMVSLGYVDKILAVDTSHSTITVEAGARVSEVLKALSKYGLTLQNFSSIQEQQMGGWTQVAAHGTGAKLPTVDEMIVNMKLVTPAKGVLELSEDTGAELFHLAKVGLGSLGIVSEMTLKCIPQHQLLERTYTTSLKQLRKDHMNLLRSYRHVRYMWLPHTDTIVVVVSNPHKEGEALPTDFGKKVDEAKKLAPARAMLAKLNKKLTKELIEGMSFTELRDQLLDLDPLNVKHVEAVNRVEAQYWSLNGGWRLDDSTNILGFDCGGQQWVLEVAFPIGKLDRQDGRTPDLDFVEKVMKRIKELRIPAPCPIEQRWTARSRSPMSPAYSEEEGEVFSWVGIIMYLPPGQSPEGREEITERFHGYVEALTPIFEEYEAFPHWAKIESLPKDPSGLRKMRKRMEERYGVEQFRVARRALDPNKVLSNTLVEQLLDEHEPV